MTARLSSFGSVDSIIQYTSGNWTQIDSGSAYLTRDANATVTFNFNGTLITVVGTIQSDQPAQLNSSLSYVLDGEDDHSFLPNISSPTIYSSPDLLQGPHTLAIRLLNADTALSLSGGTITTAQPHSTNHRRTIAIVAGTIGGFVVLTVIFLALFLLYRRRRHHAATPYALGPLQANLPSTKEAFTSPKYSNHGISFTHSTDSVNVLPRVKAPPPPLPGPYETPVKVKSKPKPARTS
ncbi:hypothetical protein B0H17DRAFT_1057391 [Mycena rosella]|uniref:Uncharacterized protein n=1 Tax=Mycena rosella TaxID=1033263 RepID=A0AAD7DLL2_MYCRO|nr:hypothetical protein B0H17DRAFT_1057391 [Mycena rosella]